MASMIIAPTLVTLLALVAPQECPHSAPAAAAPPAAPSPYAGDEAREIKALSEADLKAYREGTGMGMARAAELNRHPGPRHVLEQADAIGLSATQRAAILALYEKMRADAVPLGEQVIDAERRLDLLFARHEASEEAVARLAREAAELQGRLRAVHLCAHVETRRLLTVEQITRYEALRGYGHANH
jgi:Spy/CpxP family protein refolding chaperone